MAGSSSSLRSKSNPKSKRPHHKTKTGCVNCRRRRVKVRAALSTLILRLPLRGSLTLSSVTSRSQAADRACGVVRNAFTLSETRPAAGQLYRQQMPRCSRPVSPRTRGYRRCRYRMKHYPPSRLCRLRQGPSQDLWWLEHPRTHQVSPPSRQLPPALVLVGLPRLTPSLPGSAIWPSSTTGHCPPA